MVALASLPDNIVSEIMAHADARALCMLAMVSREYCELASDWQLWAQQLGRRYQGVAWALPEGAPVSAS